MDSEGTKLESRGSEIHYFLGGNNGNDNVL